MQETQEMEVQSLGHEDPLEEEMATHSQYSCLENPMDRGRSMVGCSPWSCKELDMTEHITFPNTFLSPCQLCRSPSFLLGKYSCRISCMFALGLKKKEVRT